jgi:hypothetical protein
VWAGAALACVIATAVPGLAAILRGIEHSSAELEAFWAEVPLAFVTALFGALQTRAQLRQSRRWVGVLFVLLVAFMVFLIALGLAVADASHTVDGGAVLLVGLAGGLGAAVLQSVLAVVSWRAIASAVRLAAQGEAAMRGRFAGWLAWASALHVGLKAVSGGSMLFGALGGVAAVLLARPLQSKGRVAVGSVVALLGAGLQVKSCAGLSRDAAIHGLPLCETNSHQDGIRQNDVLAKKAREVPKVADAATGVAGDAVSVYVLPVGGGALDAETKAAVEKAIAGVDCAIYLPAGELRATNIAVKPAQLVPLDVRATFHTRAKAPDGVEKAIDEAVRAVFDVTKTGLPLVRVSERDTFNVPREPGSGWVELRVGEEDLAQHVKALPDGSVAQIGRVEVTVAVQP